MTLVLLCILSVCGNDPITGTRATAFNNDLCFNTARNLHVITMFHTAAFFILDGTISAGVIARHSMVEKQMYMHHVLGYMSLYLSLYFMGWVV